MPDALPLYLDCDTGIDDALALAYLLATPAVDLVAIGTVSGNIDAATAAVNTANLLATIGRGDIPIRVGERDFLARPYHGGAPHVHGANGIGGVELPDAGWTAPDESAARALVRLAHEHPHDLHVLAIGPLTNLARALELDPGVAALVREVTIMGGAAWVPGNITPLAEANIHNDPEAARRVLDADWPVTLVPLDVTRGHRFDPTHQAALVGAGGVFHAALGTMLDQYLDFYEPVLGARQSILHDPLAAAIAAGDLPVTDAPACDVTVYTTDGEERGRTVCRIREPGDPGTAVRVVRAIGVDAAAPLLERMLSLAMR